eukprot:gene12074-14126_t
MSVAPVQQRFLRFLINNSIKSYLLNPIQKDEFDTQFNRGNGVVSLTGVVLDSKVLNAKFAKGLPFRFGVVSVEAIDFHLPLLSLATEPIRVVMRGVEINIVPRTLTTSSSMSSLADDASVTSLLERSLSESVTLDDPFTTDDEDISSSSHSLSTSSSSVIYATNRPNEDPEVMMGLQQQLLDIFSKISVEIDNLSVYIQTPQSLANLELNIASAGFRYADAEEAEAQPTLTFEQISVMVHKKLDSTLTLEQDHFIFACERGSTPNTVVVTRASETALDIDIDFGAAIKGNIGRDQLTGLLDLIDKVSHAFTLLDNVNSDDDDEEEVLVAPKDINVAIRAPKIFYAINLPLLPRRETLKPRFKIHVIGEECRVAYTKIYARHGKISFEPTLTTLTVSFGSLAIDLLPTGRNDATKYRCLNIQSDMDRKIQPTIVVTQKLAGTIANDIDPGLYTNSPFLVYRSALGLDKDPRVIEAAQRLATCTVDFILPELLLSVSKSDYECLKAAFALTTQQEQDSTMVVTLSSVSATIEARFDDAPADHADDQVSGFNILIEELNMFTVMGYPFKADYDATLAFLSIGSLDSIAKYHNSYDQLFFSSKTNLDVSPSGGKDELLLIFTPIEILLKPLGSSSVISGIDNDFQKIGDASKRLVILLKNITSETLGTKIEILSQTYDFIFHKDTFNLFTVMVPQFISKISQYMIKDNIAEFVGGGGGGNVNGVESNLNVTNLNAFIDDYDASLRDDDGFHDDFGRSGEQRKELDIDEFEIIQHEKDLKTTFQIIAVDLSINCLFYDDNKKDHIRLESHISEILLSNFDPVSSNAYDSSLKFNIKHIFVHDNHTKSPISSLFGPLSFYRPETISGNHLLSLILYSRVDSFDRTFYNVKLLVEPLFFKAYQHTIDFILDFFINNTKPATAPDSASGPPRDELDDEDDEDNESVFFDEVEIFPLQLRVDYKPNNAINNSNEEGYSLFTRGEYVWMFSMIPINDANFTLPAVHIQNIPQSRLLESIAQIYQPNLLGSNIFQYLKGVAPIRIIFNVGSGVTALVRKPIQEAKGADGLVKGVGKGVGLGIQTLTVEILTASSKMVSATSNILKNFTDNSDPRYADYRQSIWVNQPETLSQGAHKAVQQVIGGFKNAAYGLFSRPISGYQSNGPAGFLSALAWGVPGLVIRPVVGVAEGIISFSLGLRNTLDSSRILRDYKKLSKFVRLIPVKKTATAQDLAELFMKEIFTMHGMPSEIISDSDSKFTSAFWKELMDLLHTKIRASTADNQQANGKHLRKKSKKDEKLEQRV